MQTNHLSLLASIIIIVAAIVSFLTIVVSNFIFAYKKKERIHSHNMAALALQHEKNILESRMEIQETVQQNISREIHDNINLSLTLVKLYLNTLPWDQPAEARTQVKNALDTLTKSIADLGNVSRSLNTDLISSKGLILALEDEISRIRAAGIFSIDYVLSGEPVFLQPQKELVLFRIIQESFNNIIKHAAAKHTCLRLEYTTDTLAIQISDDGKGFNLTEGKAKYGSGLRNIQARTALLGGTVKIESEENAGCLIQIKIPI